MLPIDRPGKIVCVGMNYRAHAEEQNRTPPDHPILFAKWASSLIGPGEPIVLPGISSAIDHEAELGVVIGERVRGVSAENALEAVRGLPLRERRQRPRPPARRPPVHAGEVARHVLPRRAELVPAADVPDPQALRIRCLVNGEVRQDSTTADMLFTVAELIAFASEAITLEPGDLLLTGTPGGVGEFRDPPLYLRAGDEVEVEIEGIGSLTNPVAAAA